MEKVYAIYKYSNAADSEIICYLSSFEKAYNYILAQGEITSLSIDSTVSYWNRRHYMKKYWNDEEWESILKKYKKVGTIYKCGEGSFSIEEINVE